MSLFLQGEFELHSGTITDWKIQCDALDDGDLACLAQLIARYCHPFGTVEGVPRGGLRLAEHCKTHASQGPLLIVDDVCTTGASLEAQRQERFAKGAVIFARGPWPRWVQPLFVLWPPFVFPPLLEQTGV